MLVEKPTGTIRTAYDLNNDPYLFEATGAEAKRFIDILNADDDGRLLVLPCKVGDDVYFLHEKQIHRLRVQGISVSNSGKDTLLHFGGYPASYVWGSGIGETYFLSREEAEAKLKEAEEND